MSGAPYRVCAAGLATGSPWTPNRPGTKLKADQDILMHGYGPVAKTLVAHGLLDELHLWVHPMLAGVGSGDDLIMSEGLNTRMSLLDVKRLDSGVVILSYRPA